jgi:hypothetical protein
LILGVNSLVSLGFALILLHLFLDPLLLLLKVALRHGLAIVTDVVR